MACNWTEAQKAAIRERDRTLLVCAAAGSGKTAVLTERIITMLTDEKNPVDISRMLIVTFTRAAAGELRHRISAALSNAIALSPKKDLLSRQLMLLGSASISTIDSFYYDLVRANFQQAGFPPSVRLADESELLGLRRELMNDVVDAMYAENADFHQISDILCDLRSESGLTDALLKIYARLLRYPEALGILSRSACDMEQSGTSVLDSAWGKVWESEVRELATTGQRLFAHALNLTEAEPNAEKLIRRYSAYFNERLDRYRTILERLDAKNYEETREAIAAPFAIRKPGGKCPERTAELIRAMELCDVFLENWKDKHVPAFSVFSAQEIAQSATQTAHVLRLLNDTLTRFEESYRAAKTQREIAEFSDVSRAAYHLLVDGNGDPTPIALELRTKYDAIFIDEYQDVDSMQDATFRAIATDHNRFMVGDIKQSIYRFRGAQPNVFADYRQQFRALKDATGKNPATIFMSTCFRCDKRVIDFSNTVSGDLFSSAAESIGYSKEDDLIHPDDPVPPEKMGEKCRVVLINRAKFSKNEEDDQASASNAEALWIANEIARLLQEGKRTDPPTLRARDIAVLMRNASLAPQIAKYLAQRGIPYNDTSRKSFFENPDVLCVYSLLAALDNPYRDVYMAAALRSPFFGFTLEDLVKLHAGSAGEISLYEAVKNAAPPDTDTSELAERLRQFNTRFSAWRDKAKTLPVDRLLRYLYQESAILSFAGIHDDAGNSPTERRANLQQLYEYARTFEAGGFKGLYQFVRYVDGVMESKGKMPTPDGGSEGVSLITIHHSKGLEYPVCFLAGTATRFNTKDLSEHFLDDEDLGCAIRLPNAGPFSRANTFFRHAIDLQLRRRALEEEMRVLYVAMTRAKTRLYVTADSPFGSDHLLKRAELAASTGGEFVCNRGPAYIYWILSALMRTDHDNFATIEVVNEGDIPLTPPAPSEAQKEAEEAKKQEILTLLQKRFSFVYPEKYLANLPAKLSVSKLSPNVLDVYDNDGATSHEGESEKQRKEKEQLLKSFDLAPSFLSSEQKKTGAARGTATHEFLQFCDFENAERNGVKAELERLIEKRFLSPETRDLVRIFELKRFFQSDFYRSLKKARALHRETRFHLFLPAVDFTKEAERAKALSKEKLAVQGVIDLFYYDQNGDLILCDYKTDRIPDEIANAPAEIAKKLKEDHGQQLSYYARALEEICGKRPEKILIYSLPFGEALEIEI